MSHRKSSRSKGQILNYRKLDQKEFLGHHIINFWLIYLLVLIKKWLFLLLNKLLSIQLLKKSPASQAGRKRQLDVCEFEDRVVYKSWFQDGLQSVRESLSLKKQTNKKKEMPNKTQHGTSWIIAHSCSLSLYTQ